MFEKLFKYPFEEFANGAVRLATGLRPELAILAVIVVVVGAVFFYRRAPESVGRRRRVVLSALRGLVLGLLVLILFHPVLQSPRPVTRDCFVAVLVDDSRSMRIEDAGAEGARTEKAKRKSRLAAAKAVLGTLGQDNPGMETGLLAELSDICPVRLFRFSRRVEPVGSVDEITGTGERTSLWSALKVPNTQLRGKPVVGVVLLTDGADNCAGSPSELAGQLGLRNIPVYCLGFGDPNPPHDYEVLRVQAPRQVRRNTVVKIYASVRATGFDGPFEVVLRRGDEGLASFQAKPEPGMEVRRIPLNFRPDDKGTFRYTVEILPAEGEVIVDNNRYEFLVEVTDRRLPVLYLEGSPREEYRFLRRALFRDKDFRIASILRVEGPRKYLLQGAEPEDKLDEPPDPAKPASAAKGVNGYPRSKEGLYRFEAVILGDIEAGYLTKEQLDMTEEFVRVGGGGLLMLGGVNSFNLGKYQGTVIDKMLPVVLPKPDVGYRHREFTLGLTKIGEKHPILQQTEWTSKYFPR